MADKNVISFETEQVARLDPVQALDRFGELYRSMTEANALTCTEGMEVKFNLLYLFADILEILNILTYNNLCKVIGVQQARDIWYDVKTSRE